MEWIPLKDLKNSNPIEVAEYAIANRLENEPAFIWWVGKTRKTQRRIMAKMARGKAKKGKKYWRTSHKFGIRLPHSVEEALELDEQTGTDFWARAIDKEYQKVKVAWEAREDITVEDIRGGRALLGYSQIQCHMVFDVRMDFSRKARFVAGGHLAPDPETGTYSSVVSRDLVRLAFLIAALNGLDVYACDIGNAYLNAPCREKVWFIGGADCRDDKGKIVVVVRALYGLKSSGASWRATLMASLVNMGFTNSRADADVWRRPKTRPNGAPYYELLLVYVDDILAIGVEPNRTLEEIGKEYELKAGSLSPPSTYLGRNCMNIPSQTEGQLGG